MTKPPDQQDINRNDNSYPTHNKNLVAIMGGQCLTFRQGLRTLQSVTHAIHACFLMPLNQFITGRGGAVQCNSGLTVKAARRSLAVLNTPIALRSNQLRETKGVSL